MKQFRDPSIDSYAENECNFNREPTSKQKSPQKTMGNDKNAVDGKCNFSASAGFKLWYISNQQREMFNFCEVFYKSKNSNRELLTFSVSELN